MKEKLLILIIACLPIFIKAQQSKDFTQYPIHLKKGLDFKLTVPKNYAIAVAAEGFKRPRFFTKSPDGRLFMTDMHDMSDNDEGKVLVLENWDPKKKHFGKITTFLEELKNPNSVAFYSDGKHQFVYVAETGKLTVYPYKNGDLKPMGDGKVIATFPDYGLDYKYGGWHLTRTLAFHKNKLYVSVGSSCNACIEKEAVRATILEMNPDGSDSKIYASGLRNAVGIMWVGNKLWATNMGGDLLGLDKPEDQFMRIKKGKYFGWPYYYQYRQTVEFDNNFKDSVKMEKPKHVSLAYCGFLAHSAPLGLEYLKGFDDPIMNKHFLVALHGSTYVENFHGNMVAMIVGKDKYEPFVDGFLQGKTEKERFGRPCGIIQWDRSTIFITDDKNGVVYVVEKNDK